MKPVREVLLEREEGITVKEVDEMIESFRQDLDLVLIELDEAEVSGEEEKVQEIGIQLVELMMDHLGLEPGYLDEFLPGTDV